MDRSKLTYFLAAARREHMSEAAAELGISESTLSRSIASLEAEHGIAFFDRVGRRVRLNAYGRVLMASVEEAFHSLDGADREIRAMVRSGDARLTMGFIPSLGPRVVPKLVQAVRTAHEELDVRLVQASGASLRTMLLDGETDVTLATKRFDDAAVEWQPLWEERLIVLVARSHPLAKRRTVAMDHISGERFLSLRSSETTNTAFAALRSIGRTPNLVFACDDVSTLAGLVASGFGTAIVPENLYLSRPNVVRLALRGSPKRAIGLAFAKSRPISSALRRFRDTVVAVASSLSRG